MVYAVISDVHGNLEATKAVFAKLQSIDEVHCLGDIVGYGPNPEECCNIVKDKCEIITMGNHDAEVSDAYPNANVKFAGKKAKKVIAQSTRHLSRANNKWLETLQAKKYKGNAFFAHGNPSQIEPYCISEYLILDLSYYRDSFSVIPDTEPVQSDFAHRDEGLFAELFNHMRAEQLDEAFFGHSHLAFAVRRPKTSKTVQGIELMLVVHNLPLDPTQDASFELELDPNYQYAFNPGSVGQPRDLDRRASFLVRDGNKAIFHRARYDPTETTRKMDALGIEEAYVKRLWLGK